MTDPTTIPAAAPSDGVEQAKHNLEAVVGQAIEFARRDDWSGAEATLHACFRTMPREALPQLYIACVELAVRLLPAGSARAQAGPRALTSPPPPPAGPRLLARSDPALDYAHAVLTALRGRLTAAPALVRVRQAS
jgi:hypothetical protein